jgi:hypothetical protein
MDQIEGQLSELSMEGKTHLLGEQSGWAPSAAVQIQKQRLTPHDTPLSHTTPKWKDSQGSWPLHSKLGMNVEFARRVQFIDPIYRGFGLARRATMEDKQAIEK